MKKKQRKSLNKKRLTKSPFSQNTKKLNAYTPTFKSKFSLATKKNTKIKEACVEGISMWPSLLPGHQVRYKFLDPEKIKIGDIVILKGEDHHGKELLRVHRIIGRAGPFFLEAGDNTFTATLVKPAQILGKVIAARTKDSKPVKLKKITENELALRFRFWSFAAYSFMFIHEVKDRMLGPKKSEVLWKASIIYRKSFAALGLKVPTILPR